MINTIENNKYKDPLNQRIPVLMSYSNEVGTAISEIAPRVGAALWAPTFIYLGADVYDKYKNDKDNYNPSARRALKRAIFQGMTSLVALPAIIYAGQCLVSPLGRLDKSGISGNAKDAIYKHTQNVIAQAHDNAFESFEEFNNIVKTTLKNKINARKNDRETANFFKRLYRRFLTDRYDLLTSKDNKILKYAEKNTLNTFNIIQALKNGNKQAVPKRIYKRYKKILPTMKEMYKDENYSFHAIRNALKEYQNSMIFRNKILKTFGGFTALLISINPVNEFVDKYVMKKFVAPGIDQLSNVNVTGKEFFQRINLDRNGKKLNLLNEKLKNLRESRSKVGEY